MHNEFFTLRSTFDRLMQWIRRYAEVFPAPGCKALRLVEQPPLVGWDTEDIRTRAATIYGVQAGQADLLLFDLAGSEADGICAVTMRCHAPHLASWFAALLDRLAPARASGRAQALPELPTRSSADFPAPPATAESAEPPQALPPTPKSTRAGRLRPGRKGLSPEEVETLRRRWFNRPPGMSVEAFCQREAISPNTFRKYVQDRN